MPGAGTVTKAVKNQFIGDCLIMCCDFKKCEKIGGMGKFITFVLYVIVLFW